MCGVLGLSYTFFFVVYHHFGQVIFFHGRIKIVLDELCGMKEKLAVSLSWFICDENSFDISYSLLLETNNIILM